MVHEHTGFCPNGLDTINSSPALSASHLSWAPVQVGAGVRGEQRGRLPVCTPYSAQATKTLLTSLALTWLKEVFWLRHPTHRWACWDVGPRVEWSAPLSWESVGGWYGSSAALCPSSRDFTCLRDADSIFALKPWIVCLKFFAGRRNCVGPRRSVSGPALHRAQFK